MFLHYCHFILICIFYFNFFNTTFFFNSKSFILLLHAIIQFKIIAQVLKYSSLNNYHTQVKMFLLNKVKSKSNLRNDNSPHIFLSPPSSDGELPQQIKSTEWKILYKHFGIYLYNSILFISFTYNYKSVYFKT